MQEPIVLAHMCKVLALIGEWKGGWGGGVQDRVQASGSERGKQEVYRKRRTGTGRNTVKF